MSKMIHNYEDFCSYHDRGEVKPDVGSHLGRKSVTHLRERGWKIGRWRTASDLLSICRASAENFKIAYRHAGIDFWVPED